MVQVQGLAVEVAGRLPDFQELLDLGWWMSRYTARRAPAQAALADGEGQRVHHPDEGDDAAGLALALHLLADGADAAPIGADAAAVGRQPHVLVPGADDVLQRVADRIEEAGDRQAAVGAAVGQHRGRRHEPQPAHVVIDPLGVLGVVGIGGGDAGEHVLVGFAGEQVSVLERGLAEVGQQDVAVVIDLDLAHQLELRSCRGSGVRESRPASGLFLLRFTADHAHNPVI